MESSWGRTSAAKHIAAKLNLSVAKHIAAKLNLKLNLARYATTTEQARAAKHIAAKLQERERARVLAYQGVSLESLSSSADKAAKKQASDRHPETLNPKPKP